MELRQLEYLTAVVDDGSFTRAAERLHVAQPAVSASLRRLERELGVDLIDRSGGVRPTAVGADVVTVARETLAGVARVREVVAQHRGLLTGTVTLGVIGSGLPPELPDLMATFAKQHPGIDLTLTEGPGAERLAGVIEGRLDVAMVGMVGDPPPGVGSLVLRDERVVAAVAPEDPLASRTRVALASLADRRLILMPRDTGLRVGIDAALAELGIHRDPAYEASTPVLLCELAARGLGVALVPASVLPFVDTVVGVPVIRPALRGRVQLVWPTARPLGPAAQAFVAHLRRGLARPFSSRSS